MRAHIFALLLAYAVASATAQDLTTNIKVRGNVLSLLGCRCSFSMSFTIDVVPDLPWRATTVDLAQRSHHLVILYIVQQLLTVYRKKSPCFPID